MGTGEEVSAPPPGYEIDEPEQAHASPPAGYELDDDKTDDAPQPLVPDKAPEPKTSIGDAMAMGGGHVLPGAPAISAGIQTGIDVAKGARFADILDRYRANRAQQDRFYDKASKDRPLATLAGEVPAAVIGGAGMMAALPAAGGSMIGTALTRTIPFLAQETSVAKPSEGAADILGHTANDMAAGEAMGLVGEAIARPFRSLGIGAQTPQKIIDWGAEKLGGTKFGQWLGKDAPELGEEVSAKVRALRQIQDSADIGAQNAAQVQESLAGLGEMTNKQVSLMSPADILSTTEEMAKLYAKRGAKVSPEQLAKNFDGVVSSFGLDPQTAKVADVIRGVNKRDAAYTASMASNQARIGDAIGLSGTQTPAVQSMYKGAQASRAEYLTGNATRAGQPAVPGQNQGTYQFGVSEMRPPALAGTDRAAFELAQAQQSRTVSPFTGENAVTLNARQMSAPGDLIAKPMQRISQDATDMAVAKHLPEIAGNDYTDPLLQAKMFGDRLLDEGKTKEALDIFERIDSAKAAARMSRENGVHEFHQKALDFQKKFEDLWFRSNAANAPAGDAAKAGESLRKIQTGRGAIDEAGRLAGSVGIPGVGASKMLMRGADKMGAIGQKLERIVPELDKLVLRDDALGNAARFAMKANGDARLVRLLALSDFPEFNPDKKKAAQSQSVTK